MARTKQSGPQAEAAATTLATTLGGLPLALEQAAAYVIVSGTVSLAAYAELFATRALELLKRGQPLGYQHTVATTWSLALQTLQDAQPAAVDLLTLASFLAPDDLPPTDADRLPRPASGTAGECCGRSGPAGDAVASLRRYSLVRVDADGIFVHRLMQTVVRASLGDEAERAWASAAVRLLWQAFPHQTEPVTWQESERLLPHVLAVAEHGRTLNVETEELSGLLHNAGYYLWSRGQYSQALALLEQALAARQRVLGGDHPDTLSTINNLAAIRRALGDAQGARDLHEEVLAACRRVLGADHPDTLNSMSNLAAALTDLGESREARALLEQAHARSRRVLGDYHPETLVLSEHLAALAPAEEVEP